MSAKLDHLVFAARTLDEGVGWCEATLGITPGAGGTHPLMGTHNRLFSIGDGAYFEVIAIDPAAPAPQRKRWFDLDDERVRESIAERPQIVHWVARVSSIDAAVAGLHAQGIHPGPIIEASRATPHGELRWRITVREDGARLMRGALPALIEWSGMHPCDRLPESGVSLASLVLRSGEPQLLRQALKAIGAEGIDVQAGTPALEARLDTPRGAVTLAAS